MLGEGVGHGDGGAAFPGADFDDEIKAGCLSNEILKGGGVASPTGEIVWVGGVVEVLVWVGGVKEVGEGVRCPFSALRVGALLGRFELFDRVTHPIEDGFEERLES